jgi:putative nucleotidyltransferase with HDIG domain
VRIGYRARQLWHALMAAPTPEDLDWARQVLSPSQMELFLKLQPNEQVHSLRICRQLDDQKPVDEDLLVAALLHDVGKASYPLHPWERAWIVIAKAALPARVAEWGRAEPRGWKRPFVIAEQHAAWGAELAARAGTSPLVVNLIRRHQQSIDPLDLHDSAPASREDQLLYRLQRLDNES